MILLDVYNLALSDLVTRIFEKAKANGKCENIAGFTLVDFDGALFHVGCPASQTLQISIHLKYFHDLETYGTNKVLQREYGSNLLSAPKSGYDITLSYDLNNLPDDFKDIAFRVAMLKRNCFASVFETFFEFQADAAAKEEQKASNVAVINYRDDETLYIHALFDRVTVVYSTVFKDADDIVLGKMFMQEFAETRHKHSRAPQVLFSHRNPPQELQGTSALQGDNICYVTLVLEPRHLQAKGGARERTINLIYQLRNYLHYHIKCSKASVHMRMRYKCSEWLKILQRAKPRHHQLDAAGSGTGEERSRRTITGRTWRQK